jgi:hypothetical protein
VLKGAIFFYIFLGGQYMGRKGDLSWSDTKRKSQRDLAVIVPLAQLPLAGCVYDT